MKKVAIIGGTGFEKLNFLSGTKTLKIKTPFGDPSSELHTGHYNGLKIVHIARHGKDNSISSAMVNFKANMLALKKLGCTHIISTTSCGSLREEICPGEFIVFDQFIDFSRHRFTTIFQESQPGEFRYTPMAYPFSDELRDNLIEAAVTLGLTVHTKGTVITIDGPRFSTRAESQLYRMWGADIINMTTAPEVILANELAIPMAVIALCTDFDSWRTDIKPPSLEDIREIIDQHGAKLLELLKISLTNI
ncbi:MAG TPA: MTAP family purine nucleoside phosphorylase [Bacteroidales bacterium]|nr:MTAP family purine nucleoside phosphorylase [Bacteroidales bacterium]